MKSVVFYVIPAGGTFTGKYWPVRPRGADGAVFMIRAETLDGDVETALHNAKPRDGECVLNSIPLGDDQ